MARAHPLILMLAALLLAAAAGAAAQQPGTPEHTRGCLELFPGDPDARSNDPQPTEAEVRRRLREAECLHGSVDGDAAYNRSIDDIYQQLMQTATRQGVSVPSR